MKVRLRLVYPETLVREPVVSRLVRDHGIEVNIRRAGVEEDTGYLVCELSGEPSGIDGAVEWLRGAGVDVEPLGEIVEG